MSTWDGFSAHLSNHHHHQQQQQQQQQLQRRAVDPQQWQQTCTRLLHDRAMMFLFIGTEALHFNLK